MAAPRTRFLPALLLLGACSALPFHFDGPTPWSDSGGGVQDPALASFCTDLWEQNLLESPTWATWLGDARHHGRLADNSPTGRARRRESLGAFLSRLRAMDSGGTSHLTGADSTTYALLRTELELGAEETGLGIEPHTWNLDARSGPQVEFLALAGVQPTASAREREQLLERWSAFGTSIDHHTAALRGGLSSGRRASHTAITRVIDQLDRILATPVRASPLSTVALGGGRWEELAPGETLAAFAAREFEDSSRASELWRANPGLTPESLARERQVFVPAADDLLSPGERGRFLHRILVEVREGILPAFARYRRFLKRELLPRARPDTRPGLKYVADGAAWYALLIRRHTGLAIKPRLLHQTGRAELKRIHAEMSVLGGKLFGLDTVPDLGEHLRTDAALFFDSAQELEATARDSIVRAEAACATLFGHLPAAPCRVAPIPEHEAPESTIAYYRPPAPDGSRPGQYMLNTYQAATRPRYQAEALAWHEALPGHHLQIALAQELDELPLVRRHGGSSAFVEGWALYTERLADEVGLYTGDLDRLGMLSFDAWRAARLVVDTGLHHYGWSRERAIEILVESTFLTRENATNEVDRYIAWPGQALAYKVGQLEIRRLRNLAEERLGQHFDLAAFHDYLLSRGAVTLPVLAAGVEAWLARSAAQLPPHSDESPAAPAEDS
ncbi:MAG TPA: DUF885 domain-containing protein [Planctomycetota bacterium]|nr:DUF885 domain-containing protein [Planctomycetota bacterium]